MAGRSLPCLTRPAMLDYPQVQLSSFFRPSNASTADLARLVSPRCRDATCKSGWKLPYHVLWIGPGQTVARSADLPVFHGQVNLPPWPEQTGGDNPAAAGPWPIDYNIHSPWQCSQFRLGCSSAPAIGVGADPALQFFHRRRSSAWTLFIFHAWNCRPAHPPVRAGMAGARALSPLQKAPRRGPRIVPALPIAVSATRKERDGNLRPALRPSGTAANGRARLCRVRRLFPKKSSSGSTESRPAIQA